MLATCFRFAVCMLFVVHSQTDVSSFSIVTSTDSPAGQSVHLSLTLSWNTEQWECVINTTIAPNTYYGCISTDIEPEATLITDTLPSNTYSMKMNLIDIGTEIEDLIRIETVRVIDDDSNYYEISDFCVPKPFSKTDARGTSLEFLECCYWSDRYKYNNFALGGVQNAALKIAYIMFRSNVLTYKNEAHEGAVKPPLITQIGITTLSSPDSASSATFALTLHWDSDVYEWSNVRPSSTNTSFTKTFTESDDFCEFSSGFSLEFSSTSPTSDTVGIDRILVTDEADYSYDIEYFCNSDKIKNDQKSGDLGRVCDGKWSSYDMYDGFIYNGSKSMHFIWSDDVFLNANTSQQAFALNDSILSNYNCSKNTAPSSKITIFKDDMNDPNATGWTFTGSYTESLNAVNCPGGSLDSCSRIAGTGEMVMQVNVAQYANIMIQYDMRLSSMPSPKLCALYYNFDGGSWVYAQKRTSTSTEPVLYANETYNPPDHIIHIDSGYSLLGIKFTNNALYSTEYCWLDHIYVFGDYLIAFDNFNTAPYTGWTLYYATINTDTECWSGACLSVISSSYWGQRQYDNINLYNNLVLSFDMKTVYGSTGTYIKCTLYYSYDTEPDILIGYIPSDSGGSTGALFYDLKYAIPDASLCGATVLKVKFKGYSGKSYDCHIDNIKLWGNVLQTGYPTASPTHLPTHVPTTPTTLPTSAPTSYPTSNPSNIPTMNPTNIPTLTPTFIPSVSPTFHPTSTPSSDPSVTPSGNPTDSPSLLPTSPPSFAPSTNPSLSTSNPSTTPSNNPSVTPTSPPSLSPSNPSFSPTNIPSVTPSNNPSVTPTSLPSLSPSNNPSFSPTNNPSHAPSDHPSLAPTDVPTDSPTNLTSSPSYTPSQGPTTETTLSSQSFEFCGAFDMNITTTLNTPSVMFRDLDTFTLIVNSTKHAIYTEIAGSRMYNAFSLAQNVWNSFDIYVLQYTEIVSGVSFAMEYCSYLVQISNIIAAKIKPYLRQEIQHHIQLLIQDAISSPVVVIQTDNDPPGQSTNKQKAMTQDTNNTVTLLTGFLVATIIIIIVGAVLFALWYKKIKENVQQANLVVEMNVHKAPKSMDKDGDKPIVNVNAEHEEEKEDIEIVESGIIAMPQVSTSEAEGGQTKLQMDNDGLMDIDDIANAKVVVNKREGSVSVIDADQMIMDDDIITEINKTPQ